MPMENRYPARSNAGGYRFIIRNNTPPLANVAVNRNRFELRIVSSIRFSSNCSPIRESMLPI